MVRSARVLLVLAVVSACGFAGAAPSAPDRTPSGSASSASPTLPRYASAPATDVPSPGCGFELLVTNETSGQVLVDVNEQRIGSIEPQAFLWLYEGDPPMPWDVVVSRASDGVQLASRHYADTNQTEQLTVTDADIGFGPSNCG